LILAYKNQREFEYNSNDVTWKKRYLLRPISNKVIKYLVLSHVSYSSTILDFATAGTKQDMQRFQNRVLQIIGITKEVAQSKYNIIDIAKHIKNMRYKQVNRILSNKGNELKASLLKPRHPEATTSTRSNFEFDIPIAKK
jgi:hypothetical protein